MNQTLQEVLDILAGAGGAMSYQALYDALNYEQRQNLVNALKTGKKSGALKQEVAFNNGAVSHTVTKL